MWGDLLSELKWYRAARWPGLFEVAMRRWISAMQHLNHVKVRLLTSALPPSLSLSLSPPTHTHPPNVTIFASVCRMAKVSSKLTTYASIFFTRGFVILSFSLRLRMVS